MKAIVTLKSGKVVEISNIKQIKTFSRYSDFLSGETSETIEQITDFENFFIPDWTGGNLQYSFQGDSIFLVNDQNIYCVEFLTNG